MADRLGINRRQENWMRRNIGCIVYMSSPTSPTSSEATVDEAEVLKNPPPSTYKRGPFVIQTPLKLNKRHKPSDTESPTIITTPLLGIRRTPETSFSGFSQQSGLHTNGKSPVEHEYPLPSPEKLFSIGEKNKRKTGGKTNKRLAKNMRRTYMARNRKNTKRRNTRRKNTRRRRKIRGGEITDDAKNIYKTPESTSLQLDNAPHISYRLLFRGNNDKEYTVYVSQAQYSDLTANVVKMQEFVTHTISINIHEVSIDTPNLIHFIQFLKDKNNKVLRLELKNEPNNPNVNTTTVYLGDFFENPLPNNV
jgi:hypothetical protein